MRKHYWKLKFAKLLTLVRGVFIRKGEKRVLILKNSKNDSEKNSNIHKTKHKSINSNNPSTKSLTSNHEPGKNIGC